MKPLTSPERPTSPQYRRYIVQQATEPTASDGRRHAKGKRFALIVVLAAGTVLVLDSSGPHPKAVGAAGGEPGRGAVLFATLPCASCHDISTPWPGGEICPNLGNIAREAARIVRLRDYRGKARDAAGYIRESIVDPNAYVVPGPNYRTPDGQSVMPKNFGAILTASQIDDLVAFLLTKR